MTQTFLSPLPETRLLLQSLHALCTERLRENAMSVRDRVVSNEDQDRHFDISMRCYRSGIESRAAPLLRLGRGVVRAVSREREEREGLPSGGGIPITAFAAKTRKPMRSLANAAGDGGLDLGGPAFQEEDDEE
jgi:hypothetical protein